MAELPDAELLIRFRAGDAGALDMIFARFELPLYYFLLGVLRDPHLAEDALQETFVTALERLDGVDPDHLRGWLFTVAYHQAMLARRRAATRTKHVTTTREAAEAAAEVAGTDPSAEDNAMRQEEANRLRDLLDLLPPPQREVIRRRVYEGKKFREIAEEMGCPLNTTLARMHEGVKRLRLLWGN